MVKARVRFKNLINRGSPYSQTHSYRDYCPNYGCDGSSVDLHQTMARVEKRLHEL